MTELGKFLVDSFNKSDCHELIFLRLNEEESEILEGYAAEHKQCGTDILKEFIHTLAPKSQQTPSEGVHGRSICIRCWNQNDASELYAKLSKVALKEECSIYDAIDLLLFCHKEDLRLALNEQYDAAKAAVVEQMQPTAANTEDEILEEAVKLTKFDKEFENFDEEFGDAWDEGEQVISDIHRKVGLRPLKPEVNKAALDQLNANLDRKIKNVQGFKVHTSPHDAVSPNLPDPLAAIAEQLKAIAQRLDQIEAGSQPLQKDDIRPWLEAIAAEGEVEAMLEQLAAIALAQNKATPFEALTFLIEFYCCFNRLLLDGECTAEAKQFIKDQSGWVDPTQAIAEQLQALAAKVNELGRSSQPSAISSQQIEKKQVEFWQKCFTEEATTHLLLKLHAEVSALLMDLDLKEFQEPRFQPLAKLQSQIVNLLYFVDTASVKD